MAAKSSVYATEVNAPPTDSPSAAEENTPTVRKLGEGSRGNAAISIGNVDPSQTVKHVSGSKKVRR